MINMAIFPAICRCEWPVNDSSANEYLAKIGKALIIIPDAFCANGNIELLKHFNHNVYWIGYVLST